MKTKVLALVFVALVGWGFIATSADAAAFWDKAAENVAACATCKP